MKKLVNTAKALRKSQTDAEKTFNPNNALFELILSFPDNPPKRRDRPVIIRAGIQYSFKIKDVMKTIAILSILLQESRLKFLIWVSYY
jgi:hypothetical protein